MRYIHYADELRLACHAAVADKRLEACSDSTGLQSLIYTTILGQLTVSAVGLRGTGSRLRTDRYNLTKDVL